MKTKIPALLLSLVVAMGLWLYVVTTVSPDSDQNYYNIPVTFENETRLLDRNLMRISGENATVSVRLHGNRSDLDRLNQSNLTVIVDLNGITEPGVYERDYRVSFPSGMTNVTISKRITASVQVEVVEYAEKEVPVRLVLQGEQQEGLIVDQERAVMSATAVQVSGPKEKVDQVAFAGILIDRTKLTETLTGDFAYTLMNGDSEPVDVSNVMTNTGEIHLELPVEHIKEVPLRVALVDGGGAVEANATCEITPKTISISGSEEALENIDEILLTTINLGEVDASKGVKESVEIKIPDNLKNRSNVTEAQVEVSLKGLLIKNITLTRDQIEKLNVPAGMEATILTQQLDVKFRGPTSEISALTAESVKAVVDFNGAEAGIYTLPLSFTLTGAEQAGAYGKYDVSVTLQLAPETTDGSTGE